MNKFNCDICNYTTEDKSNYAKHLKTPKHLQKELGEEKKAKEYKCAECNYFCFDSSNFSKHKKSLAHRIKIGEVEKVKKVHKCGLCDYETPDWANFYKHSDIHAENNLDRYRIKKGILAKQYHDLKKKLKYRKYDKIRDEINAKIQKVKDDEIELDKTIKYDELIEKKKAKEARKEQKKNGEKKVVKKATIKFNDDNSIEEKQPKKIYKYYKTDTILDDKLTTNFIASKLQTRDYYLKYLQYIENKLALLGDSLVNWMSDDGFETMDERALNDLVNEAFDVNEDERQEENS